MRKVQASESQNQFNKFMNRTLVALGRRPSGGHDSPLCAHQRACATIACLRPRSIGAAGTPVDLGAASVLNRHDTGQGPQISVRDLCSKVSGDTSEIRRCRALLNSKKIVDVMMRGQKLCTTHEVKVANRGGPS